MTQPDTALLTILTPQQAAEHLGCSRVHIYRLINAGAIRVVNISEPGAIRTKTRILVDDLNAYIRNATKQ